MKKLVLKKRQREGESTAEKGYCGTFLGKRLRKVIDYIALTEKVSIAEVMRIAAALFIERYQEKPELPRVKIDFGIGKPGRKRKYPRKEQYERE